MASLSAGIYSEGPEQCTASREDLIMEHLPQVRWIATRIHEKLSDNTSLEDLISIGIIGLINAIDNFDPTLNVQAEYLCGVQNPGRDSGQHSRHGWHRSAQAKDG